MITSSMIGTKKFNVVQSIKEAQKRLFLLILLSKKYKTNIKYGIYILVDLLCECFTSTSYKYYKYMCMCVCVCMYSIFSI